MSRRPDTPAERAIRSAMASGIAYYADNIARMAAATRRDPLASVADLFEDWPQEFLAARPDIAALFREGTP